VSDLSELFGQLADRPVLLATDPSSADADHDNGIRALWRMPRPEGSNKSATRRIVLMSYFSLGSFERLPNSSDLIGA
jgi:hypothetical protein